MRVNDVVYVSKRTLCLDDPRKDKVEISNDGLVSSVDSFEYVLGKMTQLSDIVDQKNSLYNRAKVISYEGQVSTPVLSDSSVTLQKLAPDVQSILGTSSIVKYRYGHSLLKPFTFTNTTGVFFGDDVIYGTTSSASLTGYTASNWVSLFCTKFSMTGTNQGAPGEKIDATANKVSNYEGATPDYVFVGTGQSDWLASRPIGTNGDGGSSTFYGLLNILCSAIRTKFSSAQIIFITPINQSIISQNTSAKLNDYRNAIFEICAAFGYNVVDGSQLGFPDNTGAFRSQMIPDGKYPSELGYAMMYRTLCGILL